MGNKRWIEVEGPGSFVDLNGRSDISSSTLVRYWRRSTGPKGFVSAFFAIIWNSFLAFFMWRVMHGPLTLDGRQHQSLIDAYQRDPVTIVFIGFPLVGIGVTYIALCLWINKTTISFNEAQLKVRRGPLPWASRHVQIAASEITQAYVQTYSSYSENERPVDAFRVMVQIRTGADVCIERGLSNYSDARILEQWLEARTGIKDQAVPGETGSVSTAAKIT